MCKINKALLIVVGIILTLASILFLTTYFFYNKLNVVNNYWLSTIANNILFALPISALFLSLQRNRYAKILGSILGLFTLYIFIDFVVQLNGAG